MAHSIVVQNLHSILKNQDMLCSPLKPEDLQSPNRIILPREDPRVCLFVRKGSLHPKSALCIDRFLSPNEVNNLLFALTPLTTPSVKSVDLFIDADVSMEAYDLIALPAYRLINQELFNLSERITLKEWHQIVVPLCLLPSRPLEGFYSIDCSSISGDLSSIRTKELTYAKNDAQKEYDLSKSGLEYVTVQSRSYGEISTFRSSSDTPAQTRQTFRSAHKFPKALEYQIWPSSLADMDFFRRDTLKSDFTPDCDTGVFVARHTAAEKIDLSNAAYVWTAGITTWKKLLQKGIWVNGSCESLGEQELRLAAPLLSPVNWIKLSHDETQTHSTLPVIATYSLSKTSPLPDLTGKTHFYWRSGSLFLEMIKAYPEIVHGYHWSGPGNTRDVLLEYIAEDRCAVEISYENWKSIVVYENASENSPHAAN